MCDVKLITSETDVANLIKQNYIQHQYKEQVNEAIPTFLSRHGSPHRLWITFMTDYAVINNRVELYKNALTILTNNKDDAEFNWVDVYATLLPVNENNAKCIAELKYGDIDKCIDKLNTALTTTATRVMLLHSYFGQMIQDVEKYIIYNDAVYQQREDNNKDNWFYYWEDKSLMQYFDLYLTVNILVSTTNSAIDETVLMLKDIK